MTWFSVGATDGNTVARIQHTPVSSTAPTQNQVMQYNGTQWNPAGNVTLPGTLTVPTGSTAPSGNLVINSNGLYVDKICLNGDTSGQQCHTQWPYQVNTATETKLYTWPSACGYDNTVVHTSDYSCTQLCRDNTGAYNFHCSYFAVPVGSTVQNNCKPEVCNNVDDDCDGSTDDVPGLGSACNIGGVVVGGTGGCTAQYTCNGTFNTDPSAQSGMQCTQVVGPSLTDVNHCGTVADGTCEKCPTPMNGTPTCSGGACSGFCNAGFHDCNASCVSNSDVNSCGGRCTPCTAPANATASCVPSGSSYACTWSCNAGYLDCGGQCALCPSTPYGIGNGSFTCSGSSCVVTCNYGSKNCGNECVACADNAVNPLNGSTYCGFDYYYSTYYCGTSCSSNYPHYASGGGYCYATCCNKNNNSNCETNAPGYCQNFTSAGISAAYYVNCGTCVHSEMYMIYNGAGTCYEDFTCGCTDPFAPAGYQTNPTCYYPPSYSADWFWGYPGIVGSGP
jgi:hypothetical protein